MPNQICEDLLALDSSLRSAELLSAIVLSEAECSSFRRELRRLRLRLRELYPHQIWGYQLTVVTSELLGERVSGAE